MKKYECCKCTHDGATPCVIEWGSYPAPQCCPDGGGAAEWHEVVESPMLPKLTIEALAERGIEWPEWAIFAYVTEREIAFFSANDPCSCYEDLALHPPVEIPGKWNASDWPNSKIMRPEKVELPYWCKVGAWVYSAALRTEFARITGPGATSETLSAVTADGFECVVLVTGEAISCGATRPARVRPLTGEEAIGERIKWRDDGGRGYHFAVITGVTCDGIAFLIGTEMTKISLADLAADNDITQLDGSPCGVLEIAEVSK